MTRYSRRDVGRALACIEGAVDAVQDIKDAIDQARRILGLEGDFVPCTSCGEPFDWIKAGLNRRPRRDRSAYCNDECRQGARRRQKAAWARRYREKKAPA